MDYKSEWNKIGYNLEELYFEKINRELIRKLKAQNSPPPIKQELNNVIQFRAKTVKEEHYPPMKKAA